MTKDRVLLFNMAYSNIEKTIPFVLLDFERTIRDLKIRINIVDEQVCEDYNQLIEDFADEVLLACIIVDWQDRKPVITSGIRFSQAIKKKTGAYVVWAGYNKAGWGLHHAANELIKFNCIDFVLRGQGEVPLKMLIGKTISSNDGLTASELNDIPNLVFKEGDKITETQVIKPYRTGEFPKVDYSRINTRDYFIENQNAIRYMATYGCNRVCNFCMQAQYWKGLFFPKKLEVIIFEISHLLKNDSRIKRIWFIDDNLFANRDFIIELADAFIRNNLIFKWNGITDIFSFIKNYTVKDIQFLKSAGLISLYAGGESGNSDSLKEFGKRHTPEDIILFSKILSECGITTNLSFIFKFYTVNTRENFIDTIRLIMKLKQIQPNFVYFIFIHDSSPMKFSIKQNEMTENEHDRNQTLFKELSDYVDVKTVKKYGKLLYFYAEFYFRLYDYNYYKRINHLSSHRRLILKIVNLFWYPLLALRFRFKIVSFNYDAYCISTIIRWIVPEIGSNAYQYIKFRYSNLRSNL